MNPFSQKTILGFQEESEKLLFFTKIPIIIMDTKAHHIRLHTQHIVTKLNEELAILKLDQTESFVEKKSETEINYAKLTGTNLLKTTKKIPLWQSNMPPC